MIRAAVGLGGNLGDAAHTLRDAFAALAKLPQTRVLQASKLYRTAAWGRSDQPDFINAVALLETELAATELLTALLAVEREFGRVRDAGERWGPRTLDLDLLLYADAVLDVPGLQLPHPHLHERAFALIPLLEVWPNAQIPGIGAARTCVETIAVDGIEALP